jgi:hypothetical protein
MITLKDEQLKDLEAFLLEIPAKYANPILQFLGKVQQEQAPKETPVVELPTEG